MKKSIIIILAVVAILVIWAVSVYNGLVTMDENVTGQWANVETQYQRRADLIPNLRCISFYGIYQKKRLWKELSQHAAKRPKSKWMPKT